ncbi:hypothetical protein [Flavobacterium aquicola]|uniref:Uncharacterized protein n=1 Tax=Flavobacterium aquicola TaxID=1682742 RepID=A0A3E0EVZ4_9FLAO|nr:hypothetical protein [Flavobacterium aquicola]REH01620.1 hypothetical protein C8P67_10198 [Flavobacterium aquicola]
MNFIELKERQGLPEYDKAIKVYEQLGAFLKELSKKELPSHIIQSINQDIEELNSIPVFDTNFGKTVKKKQSKIIKLVEKELKIVPQKYYTTFWLAVGMSAFGIPLGIAFGISIGNLGLLAIGLPIGMGIGALVGSAMDKKALEEGRQLDIEIKY